jgi:hypothetical protein
MPVWGWRVENSWRLAKHEVNFGLGENERVSLKQIVYGQRTGNIAISGHDYEI